MKTRTIFKSVVFLGLSMVFLPPAMAQEVMKVTMEECIDIALKNNIDLQRARNTSLIASSNKRQALLNFLPSLQARINYDVFTGTFFDNNTATQVTEVTNSSRPNVSSNLTVFNGFKNHYNKRQRENEFNASTHAVEGAKQNVRTNVIGLYLNVAADRENVKISENRLDLLSQQLEREEKREKAGVGKIEEVYNLKSQVANEKLTLITMQNTFERDKLLLIQALQLDNNQDIEIADLQISDDGLEKNIDPYPNVIDKAIQFSPNLKSATYSLVASKNAVKVAGADRYPTISLYGEIGSRYSSNGATNPATGDLDPNASFFDQLDFNQFEYAIISLNIPIFTRGVTSNRVQVAKINMLNAELDMKQAEMDLANAVQQAYLDLVAAQSTYEAAKENLVALEQSFKFMQARYTSGNSDFYTYLESLNNKNRAELELINAKYSIALRRKIINILQGLE